MGKYKCQGCRRENDRAYMCKECDRILCSNCKGSAYKCCESKKGNPGCSGRLENLK